MHYGDPVSTGVGVLLLLGYGIHRWRKDDLSPTEREKRRYEKGEIDLDELERRLEVLEDPEATRIRGAVERVSGIGEKTSWDLAAEFQSLDELRNADEERLMQVPNVGPERARAIQDAI